MGKLIFKKILVSENTPLGPERYIGALKWTEKKRRGSPFMPFMPCQVEG